MLRMQSFLLFMISLISNQNLCAVIQADAYEMKEFDHLALMDIKSKIVDDPKGALGSWNDSVHFCQWEGVTCGLRHRRVTVLDLSSRGLVGSLSPFVGNLSFLWQIRIQNNTFEGVIHNEIGHLFRLEMLGLNNNSFEGNVPASLSNCNKLVGTIQQEVGSLLKLVNLGNLTSLELISALGNHFGGSIPYAIGQLKKLRFVGMGSNQLHGGKAWRHRWSEFQRAQSFVR